MPKFSVASLVSIHATGDLWRAWSTHLDDALRVRAVSAQYTLPAAEFLMAQATSRREMKLDS